MNKMVVKANKTRTCEVCNKAIRSWNKSGLCAYHNVLKKRLKKREDGKNNNKDK